MNEKYLPELCRPCRLPSFGIHQLALTIDVTVQLGDEAEPLKV